MPETITHTEDCIELAALRLWDNSTPEEVPAWRDALRMAPSWLRNGDLECSCNVER